MSQQSQFICKDSDTELEWTNAGVYATTIREHNGRLYMVTSRLNEGMQTMRTLGRNMTWMIRNLNVNEDGHPELESPLRTNFIR